MNSPYPYAEAGEAQSGMSQSIQQLSRFAGATGVDTWPPPESVMPCAQSSGISIWVLTMTSIL
ncbi:MAG: hypothetical protein GC188_07695 [Alphaproteobacteria bacterium]|nr:hypothetical protein [Alphaproteobacteria bacterium]